MSMAKPNISFFENLINAENDLESQFSNDYESVLNTPNFSPLNLHEIASLNSKTFSIFHLNIRSMSKNFENLKLFLSNQSLTQNFKLICLTETWAGENFNETHFCIPNYKAVHQMRAGGKAGGGICLFIHDSLDFKMRKDLSINCSDCEALSVEILHKSCKNIIVTCSYRPPSGTMKTFNKYCSDLFQKTEKKHFFLTGDLNINSLDYDSSKPVKTFFNCVFENSLLPLINKPTRITRSKQSIIDHIITNCLQLNTINTGIIQTDISDHFPIFCTVDNLLVGEPDQIKTNHTFFKRNFDEPNMTYFKHLLTNETDWSLIYQPQTVNSAYEIFSRYFSYAYNKAFPNIEIQLNNKTLKSPWITKGLLKSSKTKQRLYQNFLKKMTYQNEKNYKKYKNMFENLKKKRKEKYYSDLISKYKGNAKKIWEVIKDVSGQHKHKSNQYPKRFLVNDQYITNKNSISDCFNKFFIEIGENLSSKIPLSTKSFTDYLKPCNETMKDIPITEEELSKSFLCLKNNKSSGLDDLNVNVIKKCFHEIKFPLLHIFNTSLSTGIFPDELKMAKVLPIYKKGNKNTMSNYRPISILPCFSKVLEKVVYNRLYDYITKNDIFYKKQFGFQKNNSTFHAILSLTDSILSSFENNEFVLGIFIDLAKAFDTVNHQILLDKLQNYGVKSNMIKWFKSYLSKRKQCVSYENVRSVFKKIKCGVPQGSILGPLLFLLYINDLPASSKLSELILFADDTNIFYSHRNIKDLFKTVNSELSQINEWFKANKLSLNVDKTNFTLFHKESQSDNLPLKLPTLYLNDIKIKREKFIKFLGVYIDEHINWKRHIDFIDKKVSKTLGILYRVRKLLNVDCLKLLYFSFMHSHLSYANIAWASTNQRKTRKLYIKQKKASRIILNLPNTTHAEPLLNSLKIQNVYKINLIQILQMMQKVWNKESPLAIQSLFKKVVHQYPTRASKENFFAPRFKNKVSSYTISKRGPRIWNKILPSKIKHTKNFQRFSRELKQFVINSEIKDLFNF